MVCLLFALSKRVLKLLYSMDEKEKSKGYWGPFLPYQVDICSHIVSNKNILGELRPESLSRFAIGAYPDLTAYGTGKGLQAWWDPRAGTSIGPLVLTEIAGRPSNEPLAHPAARGHAPVPQTPDRECDFTG